MDFHEGFSVAQLSVRKENRVGYILILMFGRTIEKNRRSDNDGCLRRVYSEVEHSYNLIFFYRE